MCEYIRIAHLRNAHWEAIFRWATLSKSIIRIAHPKQSCKNVQTVRTSRCYFFWPVLIFGKSTRKTGEDTRKQAKTGENRRFFGANFFEGKIGRC